MEHRLDSYLELSTTRIIRALRPLRTKCESLSASRPLPPKACATYASSFRNKEPCVSSGSKLLKKPSLAMLSSERNPVNHTLINLQLSKKIKEVTEAFRNIVQISLGIGLGRKSLPRAKDAPNNHRVSSLAALCCAVVGEHMEGEVEAHHELQENISSFDDEDISIVTELYDSLPPHYRRFVFIQFRPSHFLLHCNRRHAVISHALSIILSAFPNHSDLHSSLLEVTTTYSLSRESQLLLNALFTAIFSPRAHFTQDSILGAANSHYLTSLHDKCCTPNSGINSRTFTRLLVDVLLSSGYQRASDVWTSPALSLFMRHIRSLDIPSYMDLCTGMLECLSSLTRSHPRGKGIGTSSKQLWMLLGKKLRGVPFRFSSNQDCVFDEIRDQNLNSVFEFLAHVFSDGLHRDASEDSSEARKLFAILALCCISSDRLNILGLAGEGVLVTLLSGLESKTDAYSKLVSSIYPVNTADDIPPPALTEWEKYTKHLRVRKLYAHEAAFWSSVLRHVETLAFQYNRAKPHAYRPLLLSLRMELVDRVGEAERLQFGADTVSLIRPGAGSTISSADQESDWRWDDLVDCWVRKTPMVPKKRKRPLIEPGGSPMARKNLQMKRSSLEQWTAARAREDGYKGNPLPVGRRLFTVSSVISTQHQSIGSSKSSLTNSTLPTQSTISRKRSPSLEPTPASSMGCTSDSENFHPGKPILKKSRRSSNLTSILADAQTNRVVLHDDSTATCHDSTFASPSQGPSMKDDFDILPGVCTADQLSSDDLNLFAYPSSPIKRY